MPRFTSTATTVANHDVTPDGDFGAMQTEPTSPRISHILNWTSLLQRALAITRGH